MAAEIAAPHPLAASAQTRNVILFSACTCLQYLAAPVLYVGMTQAALCKKLGASPVAANLPETAFFWMTVTPVFLAWWLPGVVFLKRMLATCYLAAAGGLALVALSLVAPVSNEVKIAAVVIQGAVSGAAMPTAIALLWEAIGRGVAESRRGFALALAFGFGPFLAFASSLTSQQLLSGRLWGLMNSPLEPPWNFVAVFGGAVPLMVAAAVLSPWLVIPATEEARLREPILKGLLEFLKTPLLAKATVVTILLYVGNTITANMNLYTKEVLLADPESWGGRSERAAVFLQRGGGTPVGVDADPIEPAHGDSDHRARVRRVAVLGDLRLGARIPFRIRTLWRGRAGRGLRPELHPVGLRPRPTAAQYGLRHDDDGPCRAGRHAVWGHCREPGH